MPIIDLGDLFCVMQGKYDPRKALGNIREEHNVPNYLDAVVETATDWFAPYAENFAVIGRGNHELSQVDRHGIDLISNFCRGMKQGGSSVCEAGIGGYITLRFKIREKKWCTKRIWFHHGTDIGNAPVTKGTTGAMRRAAIYPDADIILSGHIHEQWAMPIERYRINQGNSTFTDKAWVIQVPTYKQEFDPEGSSWHCQQGRTPKPLGAWILRFEKGIMSADDVNAGNCITVTPIPLQ